MTHSLIRCLLTCCLPLGGCAAPLKPSDFAETRPAFDPIEFWTGKTASWGVMENRDGDPTAIVTTTTLGELESPDSLHMVQTLVVDGKTSIRDWHIRRLADGHFEATANDIIGIARATPHGRTLYWNWTLATRPGNGWYNVNMQQWMYLADNGTLMNRTVIRKFGIKLAQVSEQFVRQND